MKENILILVNSFISCSKKQYFKTQLINTEHMTQNTDTEHRTQTHVKNGLYISNFEREKLISAGTVGKDFTSDHYKHSTSALKKPCPLLFEAVTLGNVACVSILLENGFTFETRDTNGWNIVIVCPLGAVWAYYIKVPYLLVRHRKRLYTRLNKVMLCFSFGSSRQTLKVREVKCVPRDPAITCPVLFKGSRSPLSLA